VKLALVVGTLRVGGTEVQACRLAAQLSDAGHEVTVLVLGESGPLATTLRRSGIPFAVFSYTGLLARNRRGRRRLRVRDLAKLYAFARALHALKPDVCHAFLYWSYVFAMPVAAIARTPVRVSARRGITRAGDSSVRARLERASNRFAHVIVANSCAVASDVVSHERVSPSRVVVIPNGVDVPAKRAELRREPAVGLMVANLIEYKGHADVVSALTMIDDPPVIRMIGEGPERGALQRQIRVAKLESVAVLQGAICDAAELFVDVQFALLASHEEGFPNAVLEAMAAGLPVVATRVGGVSEVIEDGVHGLLVPPRTPAALAAAIERVALDPTLRCRLGRAARERARDYSWDRCTRSHEHLYQGLPGP
jgi:glycosyltransferase involved in cell wall biosynthesis